MVRHKLIFTHTLFFLVSIFSFTSATYASKTDRNFLETRRNISHSLTSEIRKNLFPRKIKMNLNDQQDEYKIEYTLDPAMQKFADNLLEKYKPDYGAILMINAKTGEILAMASQQRSNPSAENLTLKASFPAASVFKVVTATAAVDYAKVNPQQKIAFNGGNYTLYKKNVLSDKINRWTRFITLKDAFARSINTAFGRLTIENLNPTILSDYADKFLFNSELATDFNVEKSVANVPAVKGFELTQVASGYNRQSTMSPVHGAMIAATIVNEGKMATPFIVKSIKNSDDQIVYTGKPFYNPPVMSKASSEKIKEMMEQTVLTGTSRKTFKKMVKDKKFSEIQMGGKTGHFSGTNPKGTNDWFVGYAEDGETQIAIAAITVNVKKWTVKSSALAQMMFKKYYE